MKVTIKHPAEKDGNLMFSPDEGPRRIYIVNRKKPTSNTQAISVDENGTIDFWPAIDIRGFEPYSGSITLEND